jgi:ABC-type spermidine/putrescine transport system permease subunit II
VPLIMLVIFPMMLNLVVRSFGWIALLTNRGLVNNLLIQLGLIAAPLKLMFNLTGLMIGMTHIYLPFMVLMLVAAIRNVPGDVEAAAATLGSSRLHVFAAVTLPLSAPGILAGSILVFVLTISALVTPRMLGGPTYKVMATLIYDEFMQLLDWPSGARRSPSADRDGDRRDLAVEPADQALGGHGMSARATATTGPARCDHGAFAVIVFLQIPVIVVVLAAFSTTSYLTIPPQGIDARLVRQGAERPELSLGDPDEPDPGLRLHGDLAPARGRGRLCAVPQGAAGRRRSPPADGAARPAGRRDRRRAAAILQPDRPARQPVRPADGPCRHHRALYRALGAGEPVRGSTLLSKRRRACSAPAASRPFGSSPCR